VNFASGLSKGVSNSYCKFATEYRSIQAELLIQPRTGEEVPIARR
jgi:hypothetical protein